MTAFRPDARHGVAGAFAVVVIALLVSSTSVAPPGNLGTDLAAALKAPDTPYVQHVVVVVLENEVLSEVKAHGHYETYLAGTYGNVTNQYAACHPSAPNYLSIVSAETFQCGSDNWNNYTNTTLMDQVHAAGLTWGAYAESLPSNACTSPGTATIGLFATRHVPALYFANVTASASSCDTHVLSSNVFNDSVANGTLRNFSFYTPNLCDDGHNGCGGNTTNAQMTSQADTWLKDWLSPILNHTGKYSSPKEQALINHTAFLLTWDEGTGSNAGFGSGGIKGGDNYAWCQQNGATNDAICGGHIYTAIVSPYSLHRSFTTKDSTYGITATIEWLLHLKPLDNPGHYDQRVLFPAYKGLFNFTSNS
jgi:hypothetical protein